MSCMNLIQYFRCNKLKTMLFTSCLPMFTVAFLYRERMSTHYGSIDKRRGIGLLVNTVLDMMNKMLHTSNMLCELSHKG